MAKVAFVSILHLEQTADSRQQTAKNSILLYLSAASCELSAGKRRIGYCAAPEYVAQGEMG